MTEQERIYCPHCGQAPDDPPDGFLALEAALKTLKDPDSSETNKYYARRIWKRFTDMSSLLSRLTDPANKGKTFKFNRLLRPVE